MRGPSPPLPSALPHPALRPFVVRYSALEVDLPSEGAPPAPTIPAGGAALVVRWDGTMAIADGPARGAVPWAALAGQTTRSGRVVLGGSFRAFLVLFTPAGASDLFGLALGEIRDRSVAAADALGPEAGEWAERLAAAPSFAARCAVADGVLLAHARRRAPAPGLGAAAASLVVQGAGGIRVAALAHALAVSERTLRRRFADEVGLPAKAFAQLARFRAAHGFLARTPGATWADAVVRFGFVDQSHLDRAYRRFAGEPPSRRLPAPNALDHATGMGGA